MSTPLYRVRAAKNLVAQVLAVLATLFGIFWLVWIMWTTLRMGVSSLNLALFTEMTNTLSNTLSDSGFPGLKRYFFLDLEGDHVVMIIRHGTDLLQGILMNSQKVNLGLLLSVALPKMLTSVEKARA